MDELSQIYPSLRIHPHPIKIPRPLSPPHSEDDDDWLDRAGYRHQIGFAKWFGFKIPQESAQADKLIEAFKTYPTRHHPGWIKLVTNPYPPKFDSDDEWLDKAGYNDLKGFKKFYGIELEGPSRRLLMRFRDKHQSIWQNEKAKREASELPEIQKDALVDISCAADDRLEQNKFRKTEKSLSEVQVEEAVKWHERQRHLGYRDLKQLAIDGVIHGLPDFMSRMEVNDIPVCEHCTKVLGMKDR
jgi:hypothetical protein